MNRKLLDALAKKNTQRPPVWLMRQAGRYMPQYQALRKSHSLEQMFRTSALATEVTKLPVDLLDVDAAIVFSDILLIGDVIGRKVVFPQQGGPYFDRPITSVEEVENIKSFNVQSLDFVAETIRQSVRDLDVPLIGFCGAPFTVACYLLKQSKAQGFSEVREWIEKRPEALENLLEKLAEASTAFLKLQIQAGAGVVQIFDSWADLLSHEEFLRFSLPFLQKITAEIQKKVPVILFCRGASMRAKELAEAKPDAISFDGDGQMHLLRKQLPQLAIQGNIPPECLKDPKEKIREKTLHLLETMHADRAFIVNLGHGVLPDTPFEHVKYFVNLVKGVEC